MKDDDVFRKLLALLDDPEAQWQCENYTCRLKDIAIWTANIPVLNTNTYPVPLPLSLYQKWQLWNHVKRARVNWLRRRIEEQTK